jgi:hypothetical protein
MKCFTATDNEIRACIHFTVDPYPAVEVGEAGRGRKLARVPIARSLAESIMLSATSNHTTRASVSNAYILTDASVIRTREKNTLLIVEERDGPDYRAMVLVNVTAGYRGSTAWTSVTGEVLCPKRGEASCFMHECGQCGAVYVAVADRHGWNMVHPDEGIVPAPFPPAGITILAEGAEAQGDAGRMGGHDVRLLIMEPGSSFRVHRYGRLYGAPAERIISWDGQEMKIGTLDEIHLPSDEVADGDVI